MIYPDVNSIPKVAVVGGGIAGSTSALRLSELGLATTLIEQSESLVNGPPLCHLHAGGSFYRDISDEQCLELLEQSIATVNAFPHCANIRPTVIAVPKVDAGHPLDLIPRLEKLRSHYGELVKKTGAQILGEPENYFLLFEEAELRELAKRPLPEEAITPEDWLVPVAQQLEFSQVKFPLILVQEYGLSGFRFAATAMLAAETLPLCDLKLDTQLVDVQSTSTDKWELHLRNKRTGESETLFCDYLVNACGFRSGILDDILRIERKRMVEYKAAYVARWPECPGQWPEVIFHGKRGTPDGMAQLTPYPETHFQLHGMTQAITLFEDGLAASGEQSAQPKLPDHLLSKIVKGWDEEDLRARTQGSIEHMAKFIPAFSSAVVGGRPMCGAQQIPGEDPSLRAANVSYVGDRYARAEIVKACSAVTAAENIAQHLSEQGLIPIRILNQETRFKAVQGVDRAVAQSLAEELAVARGFPSALARQ